MHSMIHIIGPGLPGLSGRYVSRAGTIRLKKKKRRWVRRGQSWRIINSRQRPCINDDIFLLSRIARYTVLAFCIMSIEESDGVAPTENLAIGISFGNSNSSIAYTFGV